MAKCAMKCEIFSRVVGYHRPVQQWNKGKQEEFKDRVEFDEKISNQSDKATRGFPKTAMEMQNKFTF
jgi:ribonucleoside-triphosphate reductase